MRKPTKIKEMLGTINTTRQLKDEFVPSLLAVVPEPPAEFSARTKQAWIRIAGELLDAGILHSIDLYLLEEYCKACEYQLKCEADIQKYGVTYENIHGGQSANAAITIWQQLEKTKLSIGAVLGLGASNRTRIGGAKKKDTDEFLELLKSKPV